MIQNLNSLTVIAKSARILVESACRAGIDVIALDQFGDIDTLKKSRHCLLNEAMLPDQIISSIKSLDLEHPPVIVYASGVDNNPDLIEQLQQRYQVLGNSAHTIRQVRNPRLFFCLLDKLNISYPANSYVKPKEDNWLLKRTDMEGGLGVSPARFAREKVSESGSYFQQQLKGSPFSVLFLADGKSSRIIGYNTQWVVSEYPSQPYLFQGLANRYVLSNHNQQLIETWISSIIATTGLQGLNSIDCLDVNGKVVVLEINPRPSASVALYDNDYAQGLLIEHIKSFIGEAWSNPLPHSQPKGCWVVYAPADMRITKNFKWPYWVSDRPAINTLFNRGEPICTLQASADTIAQVKLKLKQRCAMISSLFLNSSYRIESA